MRNIFLIIILAFAIKLFGGSEDSLKKVILNKNLPDTMRIEALSRLSIDYEFSNDLVNAEIYAKQLYTLSSTKKSHFGLGDYYNYVGRKFYYKQSYDSAITNWRRALNEYEIGKINVGISSALNNIAATYAEMGETKKSILEHRKLIEFNKKNNDLISLSSSYSNLGLCFMNIAENDSAIHYITLASRIGEKSNFNNSLASDYYNLAVINCNIKEPKKALYYLGLIFSIKAKGLKPNLFNMIYNLKSKIYESLGLADSTEFYVKKAIASSRASEDKYSLIEGLNHLGQMLIDKKDLKGANIVADEAIKLSKEMEGEGMIADVYYLKGDLLVSEKKYEEAAKYYNMSLSVASKNKSSTKIIENLKGLANCNALSGKFKESTMYLDSIINYKDRLNEQAKFKNIKEIEAQFETEKKDLQIQKSNSDLKVTEAESKRKSLILIIGSVALMFTLFFAVIALVNFRKAKKANTLVQSQNKALEQKNHEVELQKNLVLEKQEEIISSINYAKKIQSAVLTGEEVWKRISKEYFILFKPKDIVSGDFYWAHVLPNGRAIFALADCTGHGVPGGFMSMLGNSFLNELVVENKIFNAAAILNKLREKIIKALDQKGNSEQKDGMDIVLCVWNKMDNTLEFAGANNNLYFVRDHKMNELKGNKMPIGTYVTDNTPFTSQTIQLQKGDCIYLTTDGFADQFGGPQGKKYKYKQMEDVLLTIHDIPMDQQAEILEKELNDWKNELEQVDDVCVLGIRV